MNATIDQLPAQRARQIRFAVVLIFAIQLSFAAAVCADDWRSISETWHVLEINGRKAGWSSEVVEDDGARYRTVSEQHITIPRGPEDVASLKLEATLIESHSGEPISIRVVRTLSAVPEIVEWSFREDVIDEVTRQGDREASRQIEHPDGTWLMPRAAWVFEAARRKAGATSIDYRTLDVTSAFRICDVRMERTGESVVEFDGRSIPVTKWRVTESGGGGNGAGAERIVFVSEDDIVVRSEEHLGAMHFIARLATREEALTPWGAGPQLMVQAFIRPSDRIRAAHRTTTASYRVRTREGDLPAFPSAGAQRFEAEDGGGGLVRLDTRDPLPATAEEQADGAYLAASPLIDCDDPAIVELAARGARAGGDEPLARALALRQMVNRYITDAGLETAFASASETVESRAGDCSEHAVLLCAVLRAQKIPARVASGLVYAESFAGEQHIFAWHMWTQALIAGEWVDLDATISRPFSAAHILTGVTALADGALGEEMSRMVRLMGNLDVEVIDVGYDR